MKQFIALALCGLVLALALPGQAGQAGQTDADVMDDIEFADLAAVFRKHCVRVYLNGKSHDGDTPSVGDFAADIRNERSTPVGGYWWDERHVIMEDPVIHDNFIRSIEIGLPFSDLRYPARIAGRFVKMPAILLEVLPGEGGLAPQAFPLEFADGDLEDCPALSYVLRSGEWRIKGDMWPGPVTVADAGRLDMELGANGVIFSPEGLALGFAFGDSVAAGDDIDHWSGADVRSSPVVTAEETETFVRRMRERLELAVLETRFRLRVKIDDDDGDDSWSVDVDGGPEANVTEVKAAGLAVGPRHLFIPVPLAADGIARIEDISVAVPKAGEMEASFVGACREYMAVVVETESDLPAHNLPYGFAMLNPLVVPEEAFQPDSAAARRPDNEYFHRWRVDYALGRRRETVDYDRWLGTFRGYRGDAVVLTETNEKDGALAFDIYGNLAAVALTPRVMPDRDGEGGALRAGPGFRPIDFIHAKLHESEAFDRTLAPVDEEEGRRLVDLGVEYQALDANTSRLFHAAAETRAGRIGMLVTHVYPDSTAARIGLREHDILLRLALEGKAEPVELRADDTTSNSIFDVEDMSAESIQELLALMPPPWPSRENNLSSILTAAGVGRNAVLDYLREGEAHSAAFVTNYTSPDYRNAPKEKYDSLGIVVKPITYEVARYFRRSDNRGVIVSKVEDGGKGSVAGLHPYVLITRVDGAAVDGADDFRRRVRDFENGSSASIELTVESFGKTRLVKIEQRM